VELKVAFLKRIFPPTHVAARVKQEVLSDLVGNVENRGLRLTNYSCKQRLILYSGMWSWE
jgi:hypothetical protein